MLAFLKTSMIGLQYRYDSLLASLRYFVRASGWKQESDLIKFTLIQPSGERHEIQGKAGWSLVETVIQNKLQDKMPHFGVCNGSSHCQTCHVHLKPRDFVKVTPSPDLDEIYSLESNSSYRPGSSRLGCHLFLCKGMHNIDVSVPENIIEIEKDPKEA